MNVHYIYAEGLFFCAITIVVLLILKFRNNNEKALAEKYFATMWGVLLLELFLDILWFFVEGNEETILLHKVVLTIYMLAFPYLGYMWLRYISVKFEIENLNKKVVVFLTAIVNIISNISVLVSWKNGCIFSVDESGKYIRGPFVFIPIVLMYIWFLTASVSLLAKNKDIITISHILFPIPIILLDIVQLLTIPKYTLLYIGAAISLFMLLYILDIYESDTAKNLIDEKEIFRQNEDNANRLTEILILILYYILVITCMTYSEAFEEAEFMYFEILYLALAGVLLNGAIILNHILNDKYFYLRKYIIFFTLLCSVAGLQIVNPSVFFMGIPAILALSCRYFDKKFQNITACLLLIATVSFTIGGYYLLNLVDVNMIELPTGTTLIIPDDTTWIDDAVRSSGVLNADVSRTYLANIIFSYLIEFVLFYIVMNGISKSSNAMLKKSAKYAKDMAVLGEDLAIASHIQQSMLPLDFDDYGGQNNADIYASMQAALEVGGDFYDFFSIDDKNVCFVVGDVSGKGIPAALFMVKAQTVIKGLAKMNITPSEILYRANNLLSERNPEMFFVTIWIGILDIVTGELSYGIAGHNPPLVHKSGNRFEYMESRLDSAGYDNVAAGVFPDMTYATFKGKMNPGDKILLYTDGVTDALNSKGERFGEEGLKKYLNINLEKNSVEIISSLKDELGEFAKDTPQFDDITILAIEFINYKKEYVMPDEKLNE